MGSKHFGIPSAYFLKYVKEQKGSTRKETNLNDEMPFQLNEKKKQLLNGPVSLNAKCMYRWTSIGDEDRVEAEIGWTLDMAMENKLIIFDQIQTNYAHIDTHTRAHRPTRRRNDCNDDQPSW